MRWVIRVLFISSMIWHNTGSAHGQDGIASDIVASTTAKHSDVSLKKPDDAATAIALMKAAIESIRTVQCKTTVYAFLPVKEGGRLLDNGGTITQEFMWDWDAATSRGAAKGVGILTHPNGSEYGYREEWVAFDGEKLRTFCEPVLRGQVIPTDGTAFGSYFSVSALLGMNLGGGSYPLRGICEILDGGTLGQDDADPDAVFLKSPLPAPDRFGAYQLLVWLDPSKGFLPKRFETVIPEIGVTHDRMDILEFFQTADGVWVPVEGKLSRWSTEHVIPPGYTKEQVTSLSAEEFRKLGITYRGESMGPPNFFSIEPNSLRVNEPIDASHFTIDFPIGSEIFDGFTDKVFMVTETGPVYVKPKQPSVPSDVVTNQEKKWPKFLIANIIVVLLCGSWLVRRRLHGRT